MTDKASIERYRRYLLAHKLLLTAFAEAPVTEKNDNVDMQSRIPVFEFLYMLSIGKIDTADKIVELAIKHNIKINHESSRLGFTDKGLRKLHYNFFSSRAIDQSDIARFLVQHLSRETVRKSLLILANAGLINRIDSGNSILFQSNGKAERHFEQFLLALTSSPEEQTQPPRNL